MPSKSIFGYPPYQSNHIACVGNNGSPNLITYADGFFDAAKMIIDGMMIFDQNRQIKELRCTDDTIIYPICFNIRHSIELYLKIILENLKTILDYKKTDEFIIDEHFTQRTHSISVLWKKIIDFSDTIDNRLSIYTNQLDNYISQWISIDDTSQTFRYPLNTESKKHLTERSGIDIIYLWAKCIKEHRKLQQLTYFSISLEQEYQYKTLTKKLSRYDLYHLAKKLPQYDKWSTEFTKEVKEALKHEFNISSNDLNKAINQIQDNYEFSRIIGYQKSLVSVSLEEVLTTAILFLDYFPHNDTTNDLWDVQSPTEIFKELDTLHEIERIIKQNLEKYTEDTLYDMLVLIYLGRGDMCNLNISENYYLVHQKKYIDKRDTQEIIRKMLEKNRNTALYILKELVLLGFDEIILKNTELLKKLTESEQELLKIESIFSYRKELGYEL